MTRTINIMSYYFNKIKQSLGHNWPQYDGQNTLYSSDK